MCQRLELTILQLSEEKSAFEFRFKQLDNDKEQLRTDAELIQKKLEHTLDILNRYKHTLTLALFQLSFLSYLLSIMVSSFGFNVILIGLLQ